MLYLPFYATCKCLKPWRTSLSRLRKKKKKTKNYFSFPFLVQLCKKFKLTLLEPVLLLVAEPVPTGQKAPFSVFWLPVRCPRGVKHAGTSPRCCGMISSPKLKIPKHFFTLLVGAKHPVTLHASQTLLCLCPRDLLAAGHVPCVLRS